MNINDFFSKLKFAVIKIDKTDGNKEEEKLPRFNRKFLYLYNI